MNTLVSTRLSGLCIYRQRAKAACRLDTHAIRYTAFQPRARAWTLVVSHTQCNYIEHTDCYRITPAPNAPTERASWLERHEADFLTSFTESLFVHYTPGPLHDAAARGRGRLLVEIFVERDALFLHRLQAT